MSDALDKVFNTEPIKTEIITQSGEVIVPKTNTTDEAVEYDYDKTRSNLHSLLSQGQEALMHALEVAKQSEHPRAFEVVGNLVKQLADVNHQLLDLTEKKQKLQKKEDKQERPQTVNNNAYFVGSTAELNKMLQNLKGE
jgi:hypothetical protein